jgi:hypothetical protein
MECHSCHEEKVRLPSGVDIETADMLVHEVLSRHMRDRNAVARYAEKKSAG